MPANKNALIRYKTIDNCLRNPYRRWTIEDLVDACSDALAEAEGIYKGVSLRTVQSDLQIMRSDKLGYNAPIEVYDNKYYRYADRDYSITSLPFSQNEIDVFQEAVDMLRQFQDFDCFAEMSDVLGRLQDALAVSKHGRSVIDFDKVPNLKGLKWLNPLYNYIIKHQPLRITYLSFRMPEPQLFDVHPYLLKEYRNRWFLFCGSGQDEIMLYNLALDRIEGIETLDIHFRDLPGFDPEHHFDDIIGVSKHEGESVEITFRARQSEVGYVATKPLHHSQRKVRDNADGSADFSICVQPNHELYSLLMSYGDGITVLSPPAVVEHMRRLLISASSLYSTTSEMEN